MKIAVFGIGYVGLSIATLLSQREDVVAVDVVSEKVTAINERRPLIRDGEIERFFAEKSLKLRATTDASEAIREADFIIVCTPTNYNEKTQFFDTSSVEEVIRRAIALNPDAIIIIKSTVPVGFTKEMQQRYATRKIIFSPEFLREGHALYDNLYPSRIIVGGSGDEAKRFGDLLRGCALNQPEVIYIGSTEAEAAKLFANTFLALRVAFFNELDTYAEIKKLSSVDIIRGVSLDPRIGDYYNNPSFGYGGYCLPKDTKQLLSNYQNVPQDLIRAIVMSNETRKNHIVTEILEKKPGIVGVYRLVMKTNSDNFRASAIRDIIDKLKSKDARVVIFEPTLRGKSFEGCEVLNDFEVFCERCDVILANRISTELNRVIGKVYSRDIFRRD